MRAKVWDLNKEAQPEVGRDYHLMLGSNVLHTAADMSGAQGPLSCWSMVCLLLCAAAREVVDT